jgi:hypothetical protein
MFDQEVERSPPMLSTEELIIEVTRNLFAQMKDDETEADVLENVICFLIRAYESIHCES